MQPGNWALLETEQLSRNKTAYQCSVSASEMGAQANAKGYYIFNIALSSRVGEYKKRLGKCKGSITRWGEIFLEKIIYFWPAHSGGRHTRLEVHSRGCRDLTANPLKTKELLIRFQENWRRERGLPKRKIPREREKGVFPFSMYVERPWRSSGCRWWWAGAAGGTRGGREMLEGSSVDGGIRNEACIGSFTVQIVLLFRRCIAFSDLVRFT